MYIYKVHCISTLLKDRGKIGICLPLFQKTITGTKELELQILGLYTHHLDFV